MMDRIPGYDSWKTMSPEDEENESRGADDDGPDGEDLYEAQVADWNRFVESRY